MEGATTTGTRRDPVVSPQSGDGTMWYLWGRRVFTGRRRTISRAHEVVRCFPVLTVGYGRKGEGECVCVRVTVSGRVRIQETRVFVVRFGSMVQPFTGPVEEI